MKRGISLSGYKGIDFIDPIERAKQHELTKSLWQKLREMGVKTGNKGRIKGIMIANSYEQAEEVRALYQDDFDASICKQYDNSTHIVEITTPISRLSVEALLDLTDILMVSAAETNSKFDGLELDMHEVKKLNPPWWKFW
ncbi:hypothetical protein SD70_22070 [Gordoniibacillus kamchatkensis]|uniref:Uncharacterized protein n=1 Tax=Gordoniibacillus kamchatkensis TaxID=1590651 RepID=A0ABR5ADL2_9BACL|nr:hypothetical protein [Paenibacillus sp. VKM B-2647]KIL39121.1 hypothetical protein SD70_22070 [Paenibacillus sp. VKM B-2647]